MPSGSGLLKWQEPLCAEPRRSIPDPDAVVNDFVCMPPLWARVVLPLEIIGNMRNMERILLTQNMMYLKSWEASLVLRSSLMYFLFLSRYRVERGIRSRVFRDMRSSVFV